MNGTFSIHLAGERLLLLPERAVFWGRTGILFISDTHWCQVAPAALATQTAPDAALRGDLTRLSRALACTGAQRLVVLGDLFHGHAERTPAMLETIHTWREQHAALDILLVRGNHDRYAGDPPASLHMTCVDAPFRMLPFVLHHEPPEPLPAHGYVLAGHLHPVLAPAKAKQQRVPLPCFLFGTGIGVLPAFCDTPRVAHVAPRSRDWLYVVADNEVREHPVRTHSS